MSRYYVWFLANLIGQLPFEYTKPILSSQVVSLYPYSLQYMAVACLSVCKHNYSKSYKESGIKFYGGVQGGEEKDWIWVSIKVILDD